VYSRCPKCNSMAYGPKVFADVAAGAATRLTEPKTNGARAKPADKKPKPAAQAAAQQRPEPVAAPATSAEPSLWARLVGAE
jgi:hypothetical protein